jgi:glycosyltransferase involved in cell wall biosynthesis
MPSQASVLGAAVVGDYLLRRYLGFRSAPEEEYGGRAVYRRPLVNQSVQRADPQQWQARQPPRELRAGEGPDKVVDAPQQSGAGAGHLADAEFGEAAEQPSVPARREAREVIRACMHLLHERGLCVDKPVLSEHPVDLGDDAAGIQHVFQHCLYDDSVNASGRQRNLVGVRQKLHQRARIDIESENADIATVVKRLGSVADRSAPDHQHQRPARQFRQEAGDASDGHTVRRLPDPSQASHHLHPRPLWHPGRAANPLPRGQQRTRAHDAVLEIQHHRLSSHQGEGPWRREGTAGHGTCGAARPPDQSSMTPGTNQQIARLRTRDQHATTLRRNQNYGTSIEELVLHLVTPYGRNGGSSRVRVHEWAGRTSADCSVSDYIGHRNASPRYLAGHVREVAAAERGLRQLTAVAPGRLLLHREASPLSRGGLERQLLGSAGFAVYDLDDALHQDHGQGGVLRRWAPKAPKAEGCARAADRVIAGNHLLADWASQHNQDVVVIPSCVAPERYRPKDDYAAGEVPRLVWIGSPGNEPHLRLLTGPLLELHRRVGARLTLIGSPQPTLGALEALIDRIPWSVDVQHMALSDADVGLMPLPDDPYSRGKCGYKLLQYAAAAIPFVASPVGVNAAILQRFGMPAPHTADEWVDALLHLLGAAADRQALGRKARQLVKRDWSYDAWLPAWEAAVGVHREQFVPSTKHPA